MRLPAYVFDIPARAAALFLLLTCAEIAHGQLSLSEREAARVDTIRRITPSVVCVMASSGEGGGSGVLISADGYAISNYHVTSGSGSFMKCGLSNGRLYDAVIVGIDPTGDVALIQMQGRSDFSFAQPGDSDTVRVGDEVMALGNPFLLASDFTPTVTCGIVSGIHRYQYPANTFLEYTDCIQIDASINPGNSGGPLFDRNGLWIGINGRASFEKRGRVNSGAAYAISVNQVQLFLESLKCGLIVDHGVTDFTVETTREGEVLVRQISELSEAYRRGLRNQDQILSFAGRLVTSANDFQNILGIFPEGTRLPLTWRTKDGIREATIRLRPLHAFQSAPELPQERRPRKPGGPEDPDDHPPEGHGAAEPEELPAELTKLFVQKEGFCNYYFNEQQQRRLLEPLRQRLSGLKNDSLTFQAAVTASGGEKVLNGELVISPGAVGLKLNSTPWLQKAEDPKVTEEPPELPGLLTALIQLQKLLSGQSGAFTDFAAAGRTIHLPLRQPVDILLTHEGIRTSRWYFAEGSPLPVGVDVDYAPGQDEARLMFEGWANHGDIVFPGRIGVVAGPDETVHWLTVADVRIRQ